MVVLVGVWVELGVVLRVVFGVEVFWVWFGVVEFFEFFMYLFMKMMVIKRSVLKSLVFFIFIIWIICLVVGRFEV